MSHTASYLIAPIATLIIIAGCSSPATSKEMDGFVTIPGGTYEVGCGNNENRCEEVSVASYAIAKDNVTFDEWNICVEAGYCPKKPNLITSDTQDISVSWADAKIYIDWRNSLDNQQYSMPTLSEADVYSNHFSREPSTLSFWLSECRLVEGSLLTRGYECTENSCHICRIFRRDQYGVTSWVEYQDTSTSSETKIRLIRGN